MVSGVDPRQQMHRILEQTFKIVNDEITRALQYLGEQCVKRVRDRTGEASWFDQTGNLRSSVGYVVYEHGSEVVRSAFPVVMNGREGKKQGDDYINSLANLYSSTYALVVVAAMNYAEYVEAKSNKDVLASTQLWAMEKVDEYIEKAKKRAERKINTLTQ